MFTGDDATAEAIRRAYQEAANWLRWLSSDSILRWSRTTSSPGPAPASSPAGCHPRPRPALCPRRPSGGFLLHH